MYISGIKRNGLFHLHSIQCPDKATLPMGAKRAVGALFYGYILYVEVEDEELHGSLTGRWS